MHRFVVRLRFVWKTFLPHFKAIKTPCCVFLPSPFFVYKMFLCTFCNIMLHTCCEMLQRLWVQWTHTLADCLPSAYDTWKIGKLLSWYESRSCPRDDDTVWQFNGSIQTTIIDAKIDSVCLSNSSVKHSFNHNFPIHSFLHFQMVPKSSNCLTLIKFFCYVFISHCSIKRHFLKIVSFTTTLGPPHWQKKNTLK